jgi:hypothetical protein
VPAVTVIAAAAPLAAPHSPQALLQRAFPAPPSASATATAAALWRRVVRSGAV